MKTVTTYSRKRSLLGKIFKWSFVVFNILMAFWFFGGLFTAGGQVLNAENTAEQVGGVIGTTIGLTMVFALWLVGDLILGVLALATRGKMIAVEQQIQ